MANTRTIARPVSTMIDFLTLAGNHAWRTLADFSLPLLATLILTLTCSAQNQDRPQPSTAPDSQTTLQASARSNPVTETIPAGTRFALVLTHPIQSRYIHRGDDIYAQITAPITLGNDVVIPPGTLVDGIVDKLQRKSGRGELYLQSMSITFPDGYVIPISGPSFLETVQGYAMTDPGTRRTVGMFVLPAAGAGVGALVGYSVGTAQSNTPSVFPPGCIGPPPFCTTISTPVFSTKGRDAIIGAGIGSAIGAAGSLMFLFSSHHFFLDVGSPVDMVLRQPLSLDQHQVAEAVHESEQHPVAEQPIAPRPLPPLDNGPPPGTSGSPGTPPIIIPGAPGPDGVPGPPIIIPGTPPGTP